MKRLLIVPLALILLGAFGVFGTAEAEDEFLQVTSSSDQGFLGVYLDDLTSKIAKEKGYDGSEGVCISGIVDDSPADKAGLKKGDIVIEAGGKKVIDSDDLEEIIESTGAGNELALKVFRKGDTITLTAKLVEEPGTNIRIGKDISVFAPGLGFTFGKDGETCWYLGGDRGRLGVKVQDLNDQLAKYFKVDEGVLITEVTKDRPAAKAGLQAGDVITGVAGKDVEDTEDLQKRLGKYEEGDKVEIAYVREGKKNTAQVELDDPSAKAFKYRGYMGVYLQNLNDQLKEYFKVKEGVLVTEVVKEGPAEKAGIKAGDVVVRIDGKDVEDSDELTKAVRKHDPGDKVDVVVVRDKKEMTIKVELGKTKEKTWDLNLFGLSGDDNDLIKTKVIIEDEKGLQELEGLKDALKNIQIRITPDIEVEEFKSQQLKLKCINEEIAAQAEMLRAKAEMLRSKFNNFRFSGICAPLTQSGERINQLMEKINVQLEKLREELQRLEAEKYVKEHL